MIISSYEDFFRYGRALVGKTLFTGTRHKAFSIELDGNLLWFVPQSSGVRRRCDPEKTAAVLKQYQATGSESPGAYHRITFHASYILAVVRHARTAGATD